MINENVLAERLRISLSLRNPRISPLTGKYKQPRPFLFIITFCHNHETDIKSCFRIPSCSVQACARFDHSNLLRVQGWAAYRLNEEPATATIKSLPTTVARLAPGQQQTGQVATTHVLTTATLGYASGAGITAAAGTRLALHWLLGWCFTPFSFR